MIAIDFDGTIAKYDEFKGWNDVGEPMPEALQFLRTVARLGHPLAIFSARARDPQGKRAIERWVKKYKLDDIIKLVTHEKLPEFLLIVDDRAIRIEDGNYRDVLKQIVKAMRGENGTT